MTATADFDLVLPARAVVSRSVQLRLIEQTPSDRRTPALRKKLAALLVSDSAFDRARAELRLLDDPLDMQALFLAGTCEIADESEASNRRAVALFSRAADLAESDGHRADALAEEAKCQVRLGDDAVARQRLEAALELSPGHLNAWKRLAAMELRTGHARRLVDRTDAMVRNGFAHPGVLAARTLALCASGRLAEALACHAVPELMYTARRLFPDGWANSTEFNGELTAELLAAAGPRRHHYGLASIDSLRVDYPADHGGPAFTALLEIIAAQVREAARSLRSVDHPLAAAAPERAFLRVWAVVTDRTGFEDWHLHPNGWLTGVYYAAVPPGLSESTGRAGCLEFGLPDNLRGFDPPPGSPVTLLRPERGLLAINPSHAYHRTHPHGQDGWRICVAFDVVPLS